MNYRMLGYVLGRIFMVEAALLLPPSIVAVIHGEWSCLFAFVVTAVGLAVLGLVLGLRSPANTAIYAREGLVIVALAWVLMSVFGALPFIISGDIPFFVEPEKLCHQHARKKQERRGKQTDDRRHGYFAAEKPIDRLQIAAEGGLIDRLTLLSQKHGVAAEAEGIIAAAVRQKGEQQRKKSACLI